MPDLPIQTTPTLSVAVATLSAAAATPGVNT
jgi:hypothetical protein